MSEAFRHENPETGYTAVQELQLPAGTDAEEEFEFRLTGTRKPCTRNDLERNGFTAGAQSPAIEQPSAIDSDK